ncbi:hypothetical protein [Streptomyces sp. NPDC096012]|uniref:hypothetical protein n=1 Tax=Streptomyces sp. NPDC096012 TaxID=3155684 RepID=UPI00336AC92D
MRSLGSVVVVLGTAMSLSVTASAAAASRQEPLLEITKTAQTPEPFTPGSTIQYTITVTNVGAGVTNGNITVTDAPGPGLTLIGMQGQGWTCTGNQCITPTVLAPSGFPGDSLSITVTAAVASNPPSQVCNGAGVSGGNAPPRTTQVCNTVAVPPTPAQLSITKTHSGTFAQGGTGTYTLTVSNASNAGTTSGTVTVTDTLPAGVTFGNATGNGWTCSEASGTVTCTRSDALAPGASYPPITLTVNITSGAACTFTNSATVSGGGSQSRTAGDATTLTGGTCNGGGGNGGGGGGSILPINLSGLLPAYNNISINNPVHSPGTTNNTTQNFGLTS